MNIFLKLSTFLSIGVLACACSINGMHNEQNKCDQSFSEEDTYLYFPNSDDKQEKTTHYKAIQAQDADHSDSKEDTQSAKAFSAFKNTVEQLKIKECEQARKKDLLQSKGHIPLEELTQRPISISSPVPPHVTVVKSPTHTLPPINTNYFRIISPTQEVRRLSRPCLSASNTDKSYTQSNGNSEKADSHRASSSNSLPELQNTKSRDNSDFLSTLPSWLIQSTSLPYLSQKNSPHSEPSKTKKTGYPRSASEPANMDHLPESGEAFSRENSPQTSSPVRFYARFFSNTKKR